MPDSKVVVIGGSAGSMKALRDICQTLDDTRGAVICVVLHRPPEHSPLVEVLQSYTAIPVHEPVGSPWDLSAGCGDSGPCGLPPVVRQQPKPVQ